MSKTALIRNAVLADYDPPRIANGDLRLAGGRIAERGLKLTPLPGEAFIDADGAIVMPGLVNGHTHLYSALAAGMPAPPQTPRNFLEILQWVWWRLDRALDADSTRMSGAIGAMDAALAGTTTLIDHHASPNFIEGSLDVLSEAVGGIGLRGIYCYELTGRNGPEGARAGLEENRRFLKRCAEDKTGMIAALAGAHASFTCSDTSLEGLAEIAGDFGAGVHIHLDEGADDETLSRKRYGAGAFERLQKFGLLRPGTVLCHCIHVNDNEIAAINEMDGITLAHNARSNMNNAVGYAPLAKIRRPVQLGTDGIGSDMFAEAQAAWFKSRDNSAGLTPNGIIAMLANSARRASAALGVTLGKLEKGAAADIVVTNWRPATPLNAENLGGQLIFAMSSRHVRHVFVNGNCIVKNHEFQAFDEPTWRARARDITTALWTRMEALGAEG